MTLCDSVCVPVSLCGPSAVHRGCLTLQSSLQDYKLFHHAQSRRIRQHLTMYQILCSKQDQKNLKEVEGEPVAKRSLVCKIGQADRQKLEDKLNQRREVNPLNEHKVDIILGAGKVKRTSLKELEEEYKAFEGGQCFLSGGSLTVPVFDPVKHKFNLTSVETLDRIEKELRHLHDNLINVGLGPENVTSLAKTDKKTLEKVGQEMDKLYKENQPRFGGEVAEEKLKDALECLNLPGLKYTFVGKPHIWKKCEELAELYSKYRAYRSEDAEVKVKEALESLNRPGLKIRSLSGKGAHCSMRGLA